MGARVELARVAAVAAEVLAGIGGVAEVCAVHLRDMPAGAVVALQMTSRSSRTWQAQVAQVARAAAVLGLVSVELEPCAGYVRVSASGLVCSRSGEARVEAWTHLQGGDVAACAERLGVSLYPGGATVVLPALSLSTVAGAVAA